MIKIESGDLFKSPKKKCLICHCVNDLGFYSSGFVAAINKNLGPKPKSDYQNAIRNSHYGLGKVNYSRVNLDSKIITVANMCGQHGVAGASKGSIRNEKPIRYAALVHCMENVLEYVNKYPQPLLCPKFGSALARGNWAFIYELIEEIWGNLDVTIFTGE
jgi:hypothetical protein